MDALRQELDALEARLADPDFAAREPAAFEAATVRYGRAARSWKRRKTSGSPLEILREGIEQQE